MYSKRQTSAGTAPNCIALIRRPFLECLKVSDDDLLPILFQPFKPLFCGQRVETRRQVDAKLIKRTLGVRLRPGGYGITFRPPSLEDENESDSDQDKPKLPSERPFCLWEPTNDGDENALPAIWLDGYLSRWLREHQRIGVKFLFDCLTGQKAIKGMGAILADDMGLGKTLQSIAVVWTLLNNPQPPMSEEAAGSLPEGEADLLRMKPSCVQKALVVCPASLVSNWAEEFDKWLCGRCKCRAIVETGKDKVSSAFEGFQYDREAKVLIASYESFLNHSHRIKKVSFDMVIADEAHRLKNDKTKTAAAIFGLKARRRILISGTPIQNDLDEFYTLANIANPSILGTQQEFRTNFIRPLLRGREAEASKRHKELAEESLVTLAKVTNGFIIRRSNALLMKVLPPKVAMNVFVRPTVFQAELYRRLLDGYGDKRAANKEAGSLHMADALSMLQTLGKLCGHPSLIDPNTVQKFPTAKELWDSSLVEPAPSGKRVTRKGPTGRRMSLDVKLSGKTELLDALLKGIRSAGDDRVVIISNFTQTLDYIEQLCRGNAFPCIRLDGTVGIKKRHQLVCSFNDVTNREAFVFLLSSKAGGCGINLIGGNRLILFDPDWNPANDKQALARIWRDGQRKTCFIYRFFTTGTIEEFILQRQLSKDCLGAMLVDNENNELLVALGSGTNVFRLDSETLSSTHDTLRCCQADSDRQCERRMEDPVTFEEDDLAHWGHFSSPFISESQPNLKDEVLAGLVQGEFEERVSLVMEAKVQFDQIVHDQRIKLKEEDKVEMKEEDKVEMKEEDKVEMKEEDKVEMKEEYKVETMTITEEDPKYEYYYSDPDN